jgi:hypothetical protein
MKKTTVKCPRWTGPMPDVKFAEMITFLSQSCGWGAGFRLRDGNRIASRLSEPPPPVLRSTPGGNSGAPGALDRLCRRRSLTFIAMRKAHVSFARTNGGSTGPSIAVKRLALSHFPGHHVPVISVNGSFMTGI